MRILKWSSRQVGDSRVETSSTYHDVMDDILAQPLSRLAEAMRNKLISATELTEIAVSRHKKHGDYLNAYKSLDLEGAIRLAREADELLARGVAPEPFHGIPISAKDLYGVKGFPTFAGTARQLPDAWSSDAWLVAQLRAQGAITIGKTHTVEFAFGAVGINPHWGTPRNPWDEKVHRIPGGSSCGAGVSLWEGSAFLALGSDTGGSIRIPAAMTGTVGHKLTCGRWPVDGVVPLSSTMDSVGGLTRSVEDAAYFFGAIDPAWGDPEAFLQHITATKPSSLRIALPSCLIWDDCPNDISAQIHAALDELEAVGVQRTNVDGSLLDEAFDHYRRSGIAGTECKAFLEQELPGWLDIVHPTIGHRLEAADPLSDPDYAVAVDEHHRLMSVADQLFEEESLLVLPTTIITPPPVAELEDMSTYLQTNITALRPTCCVNMLGLCAVTIPVGLDDEGMPVGLQLVGPIGADEALLAAALTIERALGTARERLGTPACA